jgi:hypothetical protein
MGLIDRMALQAKMRSILSVDAFAKIEVRLTPGEMSMISLDRNQVLKAALELPHEEQEALIVAIQEHRANIRRAELVEYSHQAALDVRSGKLKPQSVAEIMDQLDEPVDE